MEDSPLLDQAQRGLRANIADDYVAAQVELGLLALMFGMEVCGLVVLIEHPDHDTEEGRDDRHTSDYSGELPMSLTVVRRHQVPMVSAGQLRMLVDRCSSAAGEGQDR